MERYFKSLQSAPSSEATTIIDNAKVFKQEMTLGLHDDHEATNGYLVGLEEMKDRYLFPRGKAAEELELDQRGEPYLNLIGINSKPSIWLHVLLRVITHHLS